MNTHIEKLISEKLNISIKQIQNISKLFGEGATVPFIARYRKEMTGSLDEVVIMEIKKQLTQFDDLIKRKEFIKKTIKEEGKLNNSLERQIDNCWDFTTLEDIYLPFKKKLKTKATKARENGLEPLAKIICRQEKIVLISEAKKFINKNVLNVDSALEGARHIISEWINENAKVRNLLRKIYGNHSSIVSKLVKKKISQADKYKDYFEFSELLKKCPSHRLLAIYRGETEGLLKVSLSIDEDLAKDEIRKIYINSYGDCANQINLSIDDALKRMTLPSIENEFRKSSKEKADLEAINVFAENLRQLLLAAPLGSKHILGLDPGFRTGCKWVALDLNGSLLENGTIYPHPPQMETEKACQKILALISRYKIDAIAVGNGTAGKETLNLLKAQNYPNVEVYLVNESGASIYSASKIARDEFPDHDITVRGAVSIGRRLMDPLAELVKLDPKSIGVGQYQHDVNQTKLKDKLDFVVESCVNAVGINLNTASKHLLTYVSGLGPTLAQNIVDHRAEIGKFSSRKELLKVKRMGQKAFQQSAGFLRIRDGKNFLDNTSVHPERYDLIKKMAKQSNLSLENFLLDKESRGSVQISEFVGPDCGIPTLKDIMKELDKPGLDIRGVPKVFHFTQGINEITDLRSGMMVKGIVNNLTKFGAFVDIGIKESALLHISQIVNRFIKDPSEVLKLNQEIEAKIIDIDVNRKRISLTMKDI